MSKKLADIYVGKIDNSLLCIILKHGSKQTKLKLNINVIVLMRQTHIFSCLSLIPI